MTPADELEAKGRIVVEYTDTKARLVTLQGEARRLIGQLTALGQQLNNFESAPVNYDLSFLKTDFQKLMNDLQATAKNKHNLEQQLRQMGVDVKG